METENTSTAEGTTPSSEENTVAIDEASNEELDAFLEQATEGESAQSEVPEEEETPSAAAEEEEPAQEQEEPQEEEPPQDTRQAEVADREAQLKAENEKLRRQVEAQGLFVQRRSSEYGELKRQSQLAIEQLNQGLEDVMVENPVEGHRRLLEIQRHEQIVEQADKQSHAMVQKFEAQRTLLEHLRPEEFDIDGMTKALEADKIDPNYIAAFRRDPLQVARVDTIVQLARRARAENLLTQLVTHTKKLMKENESLKGQVKSAPADIARRIEETAKRPPQMSRSGKAGKSRPVDPSSVDISQWSDNEISEFLQSR